MTSVPPKKICAKCLTNTGIATCEGCQQTFCHNHLSEHRQGIAEEMKQIVAQCEDFRKHLPEEHDTTPLMTAIDTWEKESIKKIRLAAETARVDVRQLTERTMADFEKTIDKIVGSIESSRQRSDATEVDLKVWNEQLQSLQDLLQLPFPVAIQSDPEPTAVIRFLKVEYEPPISKPMRENIKRQLQPTVKVPSRASLFPEGTQDADERFNQVAGRVKIIENGLAASFIGFSSITGVKLYTAGSQRIRFRIVTKKNDGIFFGVISSLQDITPRATELPTVYGWRDYDRVILNGNAQLKANKEKVIQPGDQLSMTIDCDAAELVFIHQRLKRRVQLSVDLEKCPLPWKLLVTSFGEDTICIIH